MKSQANSSILYSVVSHESDEHGIYDVIVQCSIYEPDALRPTVQAHGYAKREPGRTSGHQIIREAERNALLAVVETLERDLRDMADRGDY